MNTPAREAEPLIRFGSDTTMRLSCRSGDLVLWMRWRDTFSDQPDLRILDGWNIGEGDFLTISNRIEDLPPWFELHPTEVTGLAAFKMKKKLEAGYVWGEPVDGPNLWRVLPGDRIVWAGEDRPGTKSFGGVLSVLEFRTCALVIGESNGPSANLFLWDRWPEGKLPPERVALGRAAVAAVRKLGLPNECPNLDEWWALG